MATDPIVLDVRDDQIVAVYFSGRPTDEQFRAYLDRLTVEFGTTDERFGYLLVTDRTASSSISQRKMQAQWIADNFDMLHERCWGAAFVLSNVLTRLVLNSILSLQRLPYAHTVVASEPAGVAWLREHQT